MIRSNGSLVFAFINEGSGSAHSNNYSHSEHSFVVTAKRIDLPLPFSSEN